MKKFKNFYNLFRNEKSSKLSDLGYNYLHGIGVEKDEYKAFIHYQKSSEMGNASGINNLGYCYANGIGVKKDEYKAFNHYQKFANMGNPAGIFQVGYCYQHGIGVEKDEQKAFFYYQTSANMGHSNGMSKVGYCYRNGVGISRDLQKADYWYQMEKNILLGEETSENFNVDNNNNLKKLLTEEHHPLKWIAYEEFTGIKLIGQGGFATVFYARWLDKIQNTWRDVALKLLHDSKFQNEGFIKELKAYYYISSKHPSFLKCYGVSKDNLSEDYILVLEYAQMGSLRQNLHSVAEMNWKDKLTLLHCIATDLQIIHSQELIHRDLHSGNILQDNLHSAYIADLGLSISTNMTPNSERRGVYGVLPYIAPEILDRGQYTIASDIYSFGIVMWEILYGKSVFYDKGFGSQLQLEICCNDLRPIIIKDTPQCYINLMKECWKRDPLNRPSAIKICEILTKWLNDENILSELTKSDNILESIRSTILQTYSDEIYKSKFINYTASLYRDSELNELKVEE